MFTEIAASYVELVVPLCKLLATIAEYHGRSTSLNTNPQEVSLPGACLLPASVTAWQALTLVLEYQGRDPVLSDPAGRTHKNDNIVPYLRLQVLVPRVDTAGQRMNIRVLLPPINGLQHLFFGHG